MNGNYEKAALWMCGFVARVRHDRSLGSRPSKSFETFVAPLPLLIGGTGGKEGEFPGVITTPAARDLS
jgi:hypothetical protein